MAHSNNSSLPSKFWSKLIQGVIGGISTHSISPSSSLCLGHYPAEIPIFNCAAICGAEVGWASREKTWSRRTISLRSAPQQNANQLQCCDSFLWAVLFTSPKIRQLGAGTHALGGCRVCSGEAVSVSDWEKVRRGMDSFAANSDRTRIFRLSRRKEGWKRR